MTRSYIYLADSWEEADARFDRLMAVLPERQEQLRVRLSETGGPALDGTRASLRAANEWFIRVAFEGEPDGMDWFPEWVPHNPDATIPDDERIVPPEIYRLWELLGIYIGDVMVSEVPGSRWVCWRSKYPRAGENGCPVIDFGVRTICFDALAAANGGVLRSYAHHGNGGMYDVPADPNEYGDTFERWLRFRAENLEREGRESWQKEPTGPGARTRVRTRTW